jgi:hypothetical protein
MWVPRLSLSVDAWPPLLKSESERRHTPNQEVLDSSESKWNYHYTTRHECKSKHGTQERLLRTLKLDGLSEERNHCNGCGDFVGAPLVPMIYSRDQTECVEMECAEPKCIEMEYIETE